MCMLNLFYISYTHVHRKLIYVCKSVHVSHVLHTISACASKTYTCMCICVCDTYCTFHIHVCVEHFDMYVNLCILHMFYIQYTNVRREHIHVRAYVHITHAEMYMHVVYTYHIHIICIYIICIFYVYISHIIFIKYVLYIHIILILYVYDWCRLMHSQQADSVVRSRQWAYIDCAIMLVCIHHIHINTCLYIYIHMCIYMYIYIWSSSDGKYGYHD